MPESSFKSNKTLKSVIRDLTKPLINQGYHTYFDNSYISVKRVSDLYYSDTPLLQEEKGKQKIILSFNEKYESISQAKKVLCTGKKTLYTS